jgi:pantoate kinase
MTQVSKLSPKAEQLLTKINDIEFVMALYERLGDTEKVKEIVKEHYQKILSTNPRSALSFAEKHGLNYEKCKEAAEKVFHGILRSDSINLSDLVTAYGVAKKYNLQGDMVTALNQLVELNRDYLKKHYERYIKEFP